MADSKDAITSRISELENLLLSRGISLPLQPVKVDDSALDVSVKELSPQSTKSESTVGRKTRAETKASVKGKMEVARAAKWGGKGRQPTMDRSERALCRIMHEHGMTYQDIAEEVQQTIGIVAAAIRNNYATPDDAGADYNFVDGQTKKDYPPIPPRTLGKRSRVEQSREKSPAKQQKRVTSVPRSITSEVVVDIPCDHQSASRGSKKTNQSVLEFLRDLDLVLLYPKLQEAGVDNDFFVEFQSWTEKAAGQLLDDLVNAGIINRVQAFKIRKALCGTQEGL